MSYGRESNSCEHAAPNRTIRYLYLKSEVLYHGCTGLLNNSRSHEGFFYAGSLWSVIVGLEKIWAVTFNMLYAHDRWILCFDILLLKNIYLTRAPLGYLAERTPLGGGGELHPPA